MEHGAIVSRLAKLEMISNSEIKQEGCVITDMNGLLLAEGFRTKTENGELYAEQVAIGLGFDNIPIKIYLSTFPSKHMIELLIKHNVREIFFRDKPNVVKATFNKYLVELLTSDIKASVIGAARYMPYKPML